MNHIILQKQWHIKTMEIKLCINEKICYSGMLRDRNRLIAIMSEEKFLPWYLQNFIPIIMYHNMNIHCYDTTYSYEIFELYSQVMDLESISNIDINNLVKYIKLNNYLLIYCDQFYLKDSIYYKKKHLGSEILIYGFNSEKKCFYYHTSLIKKAEYAVGECSYSDFLLSTRYSVLDSKMNESIQWQINFGHPFSKFSLKKEKIPFNLKKVFSHFENLLVDRKLIMYVNSKEIINWTGCGVFDGIKELWMKMLKDRSSVDQRPIWCIKLFAQYVLNYKNILVFIETNYNISFERNLYKECEELSQKLMGIYVYFYKYKLTGKTGKQDILECVIQAKNIVESIIEHLEILIINRGIK